MSLREHGYVSKMRLLSHRDAKDSGIDPIESLDWLYWLGCTYAHEGKVFDRSKSGMTNEQYDVFMLGYNDAKNEISDENGL